MAAQKKGKTKRRTNAKGEREGKAGIRRLRARKKKDDVAHGEREKREGEEPSSGLSDVQINIVTRERTIRLKGRIF